MYFQVMCLVNVHGVEIRVQRPWGCAIVQQCFNACSAHFGHYALRIQRKTLQFEAIQEKCHLSMVRDQKVLSFSRTNGKKLAASALRQQRRPFSLSIFMLLCFPMHVRIVRLCISQHSCTHILSAYLDFFSFRVKY